MRSTENFLKMLDKKEIKKSVKNDVPKSIMEQFCDAVNDERREKTDIKKFK